MQVIPNFFLIETAIRMQKFKKTESDLPQVSLLFLYRKKEYRYLSCFKTVIIRHLKKRNKSVLSKRVSVK